MLAASVIASASMPDDSLSFTVPLSGLAKSRRARVSLPKITALLDDQRYAVSAEPMTPPKQRARSTRKASASSLRACSSEFDMPPARGRHHTRAIRYLLSANVNA